MELVMVFPMVWIIHNMIEDCIYKGPFGNEEFWKKSVRNVIPKSLGWKLIILVSKSKIISSTLGRRFIVNT